MRKYQHVRKLLLFVFMVLSSLITFSQVKEQWVTKGGRKLVVDGNGNVFVIGDSGTTKYDTNGKTVWEKKNLPVALTVDRFGNLYVTGTIKLNEKDYDYETIKYDTNGNELWVRRYNRPWTGYSYDRSNAIALDGAGNVYVTGNSFDGTRAAIVTIKYDSNGGLLWVKLYQDYQANAIAVTDDGNVYIAASRSRYTIIKYSSDGMELWVKVNTVGVIASSIGLDRFGNAYITGYADGYAGNSDYLTVKYDANGNFQWERRYDGGGGDFALSLAVDGNANVYITGWSGDKVYNYDFVTIKYDTQGKELWLKKFDADSTDEATALVLDDAGNVYVTGYSYNNLTAYDYVTIKYDTEGKQLWMISYDSPNHANNLPTSLALDGAGNIYVTGHGFFSDERYATIKYSQVSPLSVDAGKDQTTYLFFPGPTCTRLTAKAKGGTAPYKYYWSPTGGTLQSELICPSVTTRYTVNVTDANGTKATDAVSVNVVDTRCGKNNDNILLCHGQTTLCLSTVNAFWHLLHGDHLGPCSGNADLTRREGKEETVEVPDELKSFNAPNPFNNTTEIHYQLPSAGVVSIKIYNQMGAQIGLLVDGQQQAGAHRSLFNASNLAKGIYYYRLILTTKDKTYVHTGKMILAK
jgi:hypothetical protein